LETPCPAVVTVVPGWNCSEDASGTFPNVTEANTRAPMNIFFIAGPLSSCQHDRNGIGTL
jgi:hypothetical protein